MSEITTTELAKALWCCASMDCFNRPLFEPDDENAPMCVSKDKRAADRLEALERELAAAKADLAQLENDAYHAINGMIGSPCLWCKKAHSNGGECRGVDACEDWKWRGVNQS
jgi:hypothetical protein